MPSSICRPVPFLIVFIFASVSLSGQPIRESLTLASSLGNVRTLSLEGSERISGLYRFDVRVETAPGTRVSFDALLGEQMRVAMRQADGSVRFFSGICSRVSQGSDGVLKLELVPQIWLLTRRSGSRIFQDMSVPQIIESVLEESGVDLQMNIQGSHPARPCVVQYNESDFEFISRLMEDEGIFYFFMQSADGAILVVSGPPGTHPGIPGTSLVPFNPKPGTRSEVVTGWDKSQEIRSGRVTLRDSTFALPGNPLEASAVIQDSVAAGGVTHRLRTQSSEALDLYEYPGEYAQRFDDTDSSAGAIVAEGERTAAIRMQQEAVNALSIRGASTVGRLAAGHRFSLGGHGDADGAYVLTSVQHSARTGVEDGGVEYNNTFTCIPAGLPFRPQRLTAPPVLAGLHPATVAGPPGERVHTDGEGRVKVKFPWDRESAGNEDSSCWVGVAARPGEDATIPEIGDEVLVAFMHGDPDRPIIVGSVPDR